MNKKENKSVIVNNKTSRKNVSDKDVFSFYKELLNHQIRV